MTEHPQSQPEEYMTPAEVAALFRVDPTTVRRWAADGRLSSTRTPGNHRRYKTSEVYALLDEGRTARIEESTEEN